MESITASISNPVRNVCRTLTLNLEETRGPNRKLTVEARAYDDGVAFRYLVPNQPIITELRLAGERTEFQLAKDATTFPLILENFRTSYEDNYRNLPLTAIHPAELVALPLLAEVAGVGWVAITEANIDNYAGMYLQRNGREARSLFSKLAPSVEDPGIAVSAATPVRSPWRVLMIGAQPGRLVESNIVDQPEPALEDRRHLVDQARQDRLGLVERQLRRGRGFPARHEHRHHEPLHRFLGRQPPGVHADRRRLGGARHRDPTIRAATSRTPIPNIDMPAILAHAKSKDVGVWLWAHWNDISAADGRGLPAVRKVGHRGREDRLHESRRPVDGQLLPSCAWRRPRSTT